METKFKKDLNKYELDEDSLSNIKSNIYTKYKKHQRNKKIILSVVTCFFIVISSLGIVYADEIKETVDKIKIRFGTITYDSGYKQNAIQVESDLKKEINYKADLKEPTCDKYINNYYGLDDGNECYAEYTIEELEKKLGIKLLKNDSFNNKDLILQRIRRNEDNNIQYIRFVTRNIYGLYPKKGKYDLEKQKGLQASINLSIHTKYEEKENKPMILPNNEDANNQVYELEKINGTAIVWGLSDNGFKVVHLFTNDLYYHIVIQTIGNIDERKAILEMLEGFYY